MPVSGSQSMPRVVVIGSGLAGLTTAYLLRAEECEVWLIEKSPTLGFHSSSTQIPLSGGESGTKSQKWIVDVPMRSFQGGYYPQLMALYRHLKIPLQATRYTFSFTRNGSTYFIHSGGSGFTLPSLPSRAYRSASSLTQAIVTWIAFAVCYVLLLLIAAVSWHRLLPINSFAGLSRAAELVCSPIPVLGTVAVRTWTLFVDGIAVPLFSAVGTMPTDSAYSTAAPYFLDYVHSTLGTDHFTIANDYSAATVAERLCAPIASQGKGHVMLSERVTTIDVNPSGVTVHCDGGHIEADRVVIATQPGAARELLAMMEASLRKGDGEEAKRVASMRRALEEVQTEETIVVTHRDYSLLPEKEDVRDINLVTPSTTPPRDSPVSSSIDPPGALEISSELSTSSPPSESETTTSSSSGFSRASSATTFYEITPFFPPSSQHVMATHVIRAPNGITAEPVLQTTNPTVAIDPDTVLSTAQLERALPLHRPEILKDLHPEGDRRAVYLAGSYAYPGIPLLEGCAGSARWVARDILGHDPQVLNWDIGRGSLLGRAWRWRR